MTEEHVELYKKYRPRTWKGLIGQGKVANSLRVAATTGKLPTAYGFFGPRGCGKTSAAFLLAKTLNCENLQGEGNPCNKCNTCINIDKKTQLGVNYISMANRGSADDVRELVTQARLNQPVKKQVWILDEIHNLSTKAFDALLIPLEEKSMPALFIFCSTEVEKIPQTILSRIQQRRFTLVEADTMLSFVKRLGAKEGLDLEESDYQASVRAGRGSVRDTLSALEAIVETGESSPTFGGQLLDALASRDLTKTYGVIAEANSESVDFRELSEQLFEDLRDLLLAGAGVDKELVGIIPVVDESETLAGLGGSKGVIRFMHEVGDGITQMAQGADGRIILEVALLKGLIALNRLAKASER